MTAVRLGRAARLAVDRFERLIIVIGAVMLVVYLAAVLLFPKADGRIIFGDATHHFVQLRSLVFDHDLNFRNDYVRIYHLHGGERGLEWVFTDLTPTGHVRNYMPIGPALLWAPLYLLVAAAETVRAWMGLGIPPDGFGRAFQLVPGVTGIFAATAAAWITFRLAARFTDRASAAIATIGIWLGSHALYYSLVSPSYSHAASMFTGALFFAAWLATRDRPGVWRAASWGALAGASALMRWQDAVFVVVPLVEIARWPTGWRTKLASAAAMSAAWLVVFSPQMVVWDVLYGQPFALPQGPSFMRWTAPHLAAVLLSDNHGLFTWTPIIVLAVAGLVTFARRLPAAALPLAAVLLVSWYVNAAVADWWAGEAFGARRFLSLFPLFVLGLAVWLQPGQSQSPIRPWRLVVVAGLVVANGLLLVQYEAFMKGLTTLAPYPREWFDMWLARFIVPFRLLASWRP
jgi:hypothetical protein